MDHFSGLPMSCKIEKTDSVHMVKQLKKWLVPFGMVRFLRSDKGSPIQQQAIQRTSVTRLHQAALVYSVQPRELWSH